MSAARAVSIIMISLLSVAVVLSLSRPVLTTSAQDPGTIAYVRPSSNEIRLVQPDGTNDRSLWTSPSPTSAVGIRGLEWRPDGGVLAFSSDHERACSWYETDVYAISPNGFGLGRVTNSPACAGLSSYPQGQVTVTVNNFGSSGHYSVYVQGSTELKGITLSSVDSGQVTFDQVADFGAGIVQPAVAIYGLYRYPGDVAPDVKAGQTVDGGSIAVSLSSGIDALGAGKLTWRSDSSQIGYAMRNCAAVYQISPNPSVGSIGQKLPTLASTSPCLVDWAPTASKADQFLYYVGTDFLTDGIEGIYLTSTSATDGGTKLVPTVSFDGERVHDLKWLPDGSGFLFTKAYVNLDLCTEALCSDVYEYSFATDTATQVTQLDDDTVRGLSISPDGQYVALERVTEDPVDPTKNSSAIWVMRRDGSGLRQLVSDGSSPAWGRTATTPLPTPTSVTPATPTPTATSIPGATPTPTSIPGATSTPTPVPNTNLQSRLYVPVITKNSTGW